MADIGKYDEDAKELLMRLGARGVVLMVVGGEKGPGFSFSTIDRSFIKHVPNMLRHVADEIERGTADVVEETVAPQ